MQIAQSVFLFPEAKRLRLDTKTQFRVYVRRPAASLHQEIKFIIERIYHSLKSPNRLAYPLVHLEFNRFPRKKKIASLSEIFTADVRQIILQTGEYLGSCNAPHIRYIKYVQVALYLQSYFNSSRCNNCSGSSSVLCTTEYTITSYTRKEFKVYFSRTRTFSMKNREKLWMILGLFYTRSNITRYIVVEVFEDRLILRERNA